MFDTICTLPLTSDLFAQALHPTVPILSVGLSAGHVQTYKLPPAPSNNSKGSDSDDDDEGRSTLASENGLGEIETAWRTRRHKGSCRCLTFSYDGETLYTAGTDGLVKAAKTETGIVADKIAIPNADGTEIDFPTILHALTPQTLLLATDSSALHLYDLRTPKNNSSSSNSTTILASKPSQTHHPHDDYISSLTPLPASATSTSHLPKQFVTTGGTTLAITDLRRGVLVRSEDQEEELLCSAFVSGLKPSKGNPGGEKVLVGGAGGIVTLWEKGAWDDQDERIVVDRGGEALESLCLVPEGVGGGGGRHVAVGLGDGTVRMVRLGMNKVVGEVRHDEVDGVVGLGFDVAGRMVSGGGGHVKVWYEATGDIDDDEEGDVGTNGLRKRALGSDSDDDEDQDEESSEEEKPEKRKRKKRKRGKGKDRNGGQQILKIKGLD